MGIFDDVPDIWVDDVFVGGGGALLGPAVVVVVEVIEGSKVRIAALELAAWKI